MTWEVGDRVRNLPEHAWTCGTPSWVEKMEKPRGGVVLLAPKAAQSSGEGTLLVEWDSLTGSKSNPKDWQMWIHSSLIEKAPK